MKKLLISLTICVMASSCVAALALTATSAGAARAQGGTTLPPPYGAANKNSLFISVDTVQGSGGVPKPAAGCSMTNLFVQGQQVVFRMWGVDVKTGGNALTDKNVLRAYVTIPGVSAPIPLAYGAHGTTSFWAAPWSSKGYPLGIVDFTVTVITKPVPKTAKHPRIPELKIVYSQIGLAPPSQLTIT
ncbi:MAG: hypothetical protein WB770_05055 [Acidimicrobiales bacterium]